MRRSWLFLLPILVLAACAQAPAPPPCLCAPPKPVPETAVYREVPFDALPGWGSQPLAPSLQAFIAGCPRPGALARACEAARAVAVGDEAAARSFFESTFVPWSVVSSEGPDSGTITGYYEPVIAGSRARTDTNRYPIFGVPQDLVVVDLASVNPDVRNLRLRGRLDGRRLVPYYSRAEIESRGGVDAPVIAWAADPVELFFLQIQGSGLVQLDDGSRIRIGFADQNGYPYRSLGRYLVDRGEMTLDQASMQSIKAWAAANPQKLQEALNQNPSYIFFRELPPTGGPIGAINAPLTAEYSLAVDRRFVPLGAPVYLSTTYPLSDQPLQRLMAAQDTGGAIRGAVRADFFWGSGPEAGERAGRMRQQGKMWILWPLGETLPKPDRPAASAD
jgi:membrane-bound lytic murein transglycosylase A